jgi:UDP-N-acetylglucosamine--N-acetylmuramyl-(pentapeptide) pyrophosphoryl-undecaprenol N-acetylglucosamine transferase
MESAACGKCIFRKEGAGMRVLITGGGTGGHLYPALAVAGLLKEHDPGGKVLFVGTREGLEATVVPVRGFAFRPVAAVKWPRRLSVQALTFPPSILRGYCQSLAVIKDWRPGAVFATGGYVSVPLVMAAARNAVPIFIHEQNAVPGLANRLLSRWANTVFLTFPDPGGKLTGRAKIIQTGLPIRQEILKVTRQEARNYFNLDPEALTVLITGGSRGARRINEAMLDVYRILTETAGGSGTGRRTLQFIHLAGKAEFDAVCQQMATKGINEDKIGKIVIRPYLEEMEYGLAAADIAISRAGAATIAELTALGIPAILIPYPYAAGNHQYHNALYLAREQAAVMIPEQDLTPDRLLEQMERLLGDNDLRETMGRAARRFGKPQAGEIITQAILKAGKPRTSSRNLRKGADIEC